MTIKYLLTVLANQGYIDVERIDEIAAAAEASRRPGARKRPQSGRPGGLDADPSPAEVLAGLNLPRPDRPDQVIDAETIMRAAALQENMPYRRIDPLDLDLDVVTKTLPRSFALKHLVVPVGVVNGRLEVAVCDPFNQMVLEDVRRVSEYEVVPVLAAKADIRKLIREFYGFKSSILGAEGQLAGPQHDLGNLEQYFKLRSAEEVKADDQHVKNAVDFLFSYAFEQRASDIHLEPKRSESLIRMRIDGVLHTIHRLPRVIHPSMVSRIKTMSRLDIAEKRRPQDGRIKISHNEAEAEVRVSTVPVAFGEKVVMRILDPTALFRDLSDFFFLAEDLKTFQGFLAQPHGIILVTGPTGSGKSTTLYSSLRRLSVEGVNVTTIEDPIEMIHEEFNQIAVQPQVGVTFGGILRNILRQDPDIIMIGEMRDRETVVNAIQAALTGHLVLSTLHTNDAASAVNRLIDLGAEPFLITNTVIGVMAQRLLRRVCPHCAVEAEMSVEGLADAGLVLPGKKEVVRLRYGEGCEYCRRTGYLGRLACVEVMPFTEALSRLTIKGAESREIKSAARKQGMTTLRENAAAIMLAGRTTYQEVLRVTAAD